MKQTPHTPRTPYTTHAPLALAATLAGVLALCATCLALAACSATHEEGSPAADAEHTADVAESEKAQPGENGSGSSTAVPGGATSANAQGSAPLEPGIVTCVGDSITEGFASDTVYPNAWPVYLQEHLGDAWNVHNLGVSGTTLMDEGGYPYRSTGNVERAKELDARVIFVMLGTNDSLDTSFYPAGYEEQLAVLADELEASNPKALLVLMAPPRIFSDLEYAQEADATLGTVIRPIVQRVAEQKGARYLDLYEFTETHPDWFPDGVHPSTEASKIIAKHIYEQVFAGTSGA